MFPAWSCCDTRASAFLACGLSGIGYLPCVGSAKELAGSASRALMVSLAIFVPWIRVDFWERSIQLHLQALNVLEGLRIVSEPFAAHTPAQPRKTIAILFQRHGNSE